MISRNNRSSCAEMSDHVPETGGHDQRNTHSRPRVHCWLSFRAPTRAVASCGTRGRSTYGKDDSESVLVVQADTMTLNPAFDHREIERAYNDDPVSAAAEYGAQFRTDVSGFISREVVDGCTVVDRHELAPVAGVSYSGFVDFAGGSGQDSATLAIAHSETRDGHRVAVLDLVREIRSVVGADVVRNTAVHEQLSESLQHVLGVQSPWPRRWPSTPVCARRRSSAGEGHALYTRSTSAKFRSRFRRVLALRAGAAVRDEHYKTLSPLRGRVHRSFCARRLVLLLPIGRPWRLRVASLLVPGRQINVCRHTTPSPRAAGAAPIRRSVWLLAATGLLAAAACSSGEPAPPPPQPIAFNHQKHVEMPMECTDCHAGAQTQAQASLPPVQACAVCHRAILSDHPEIVKLLAYLEDDEPIRWRKVNPMPASAMVRFMHKPHARAGVQCSTCHGDVGHMTVARQAVNTASMRWCVECHRGSGASDDCLTCHF